MAAYGFNSLFLHLPIKKKKVKIVLNSDRLFLNNSQFFLLWLDGMRSKFRAPVSPTGVALGSLRWGGEPSVRLRVVFNSEGKNKT